MPPPNGQGQPDVDTVSCSYGTVVAGSAHLQGEEKDYRFIYRPDETDEGTVIETEIKGKPVKTAVDTYGPETFDDGNEVTCVTQGCYSDSSTVWIEPGRGQPRPLPGSL